MAGIAETAKLVSSLELDTRKFDAGIGKANRGLKSMESTAFKVGGNIGTGINRAARNIGKIAVATGIALAGVVAVGIKSLADLERSQQQTQAVITSTGGKAKVSAQQVRDYAEALENVTTVDDKVIQDGENMLLTFTKIGSDIFPQAAKAATDMAVAMAGGNVEQVDLKASAIQLGKALSDPIKGITALQRVGVTFSEEQKKQIVGNFQLTKAEQKQFSALMKTNKAKAMAFLEAKKQNAILAGQKIILAELNTEFGKAGEAAGKGPEAVWRRLTDAGEDLSQVLARGLLPVLEEFGTFLSEKLSDQDFLNTVDELGRELGRMGRDVLDWVKKVDFKALGGALRTAAGFAGQLIDAFLRAPAWLQTAIVTGWGLNKLTGGAVTDIFGTLASGLIKGVLGMNAGVVNLTAGTVVGGGLPGGLPGAAVGAAAPGLLATLGTVALPVTIAAVGSKAATDLANAQFHEAGIKTNFAPPGSAGDNPLLAILPFGIGGSLQSIDQGIKNLNGKFERTTPTNTFVGKALPEGIGRELDDAIKPTETAIDDLKGKMAGSLRDVTRKTGDLITTTRSGDAALGGKVAGTTLAVYGIGATIAGAIAANRPVTNVYVDVSALSVSRTTTVVSRYGDSSGTRNGTPGLYSGKPVPTG